MDGKPLQPVIKSFDGVQYIYAPTLLNRVINRIHHKIHKLKKLAGSVNGSAGKPEFASSLENLGYILWVAMHLRRQKCDVVHIHQFSQYVPIVRFFNPGAKIVLHMNCEWLTQLDEPTIRKRIAKADLIFGSSDYISEKIERRFPEFREKIKTVYNGVHHNRFTAVRPDKPKTGGRKPQLLFVGRVSPEKGIHDLIGAMRILRESYPAIHLNIVGGIGSAPKEFMVDLCEDPLVKNLTRYYSEGDVGEDYYFACLKKMIGDDLKEHVTFVGPVTQDELVHYYRNADILVNPSLSESFGMSLVEAMASEKPVIGTRVGGMVNVVAEGETGLLAAPDDAQSLAASIRCLADEPELRKRMGAAGRKRIMELFSWKQVALSALSQYRRVLHEG
jgi:glycosyltransferase involved in cell wall biosynthesis